jgi:hypothetical protein
MNPSPHRWLAGAILALGSLSSQVARAELIDIAWQPDGSFARELSVAPGKFAEVCGKLKQGQTVAWRFNATLPLDFNIHHHDGPKVVFAARQTQSTQSADNLKVDLDQDYCWMWTNKTGQTAKLTLSFNR